MRLEAQANSVTEWREPESARRGVSLFAVLSVPSALSALKKGVRRREGMTLLEVLLTLAIFLVGSVGIIGLFVAASVLHKDAVERRTASYIAETLLANVQAKPMNEVFAKTNIASPPGVLALPVNATNPVQALNLIAGFGPPQATPPTQFPILINSEQRWVTDIASPTQFNIDAATAQAPPAPVLQPLTWKFVLTGNIGYKSSDPTSTAINVNATGTPPASPYIVIDKEWIKYSQFTAGTPATFSVDPADTDGNGIPDARGFGLTFATGHNAGAPVTVAKEYPGYPDFYYTVQYYPVNATGAEARVIVMVGFGTPKRFHVEAFEGVYTPGQY